jgi:hypothetical protein
MQRRRFSVLVLAVILIIGGTAYWRRTAHPPSSGGEVSTPPSSNNPGNVERNEDQARRKLLGVWHDEYKAKRTMTLNDDGTGTMLVELSGPQAFLMAPKLRFDMKWVFDGKKLSSTSIGGEPADKVNLILNMMGNTSEDTLLELTDDRLLLLDKDGKTQYDWRRVVQPAAQDKKAAVRR